MRLMRSGPDARFSIYLAALNLAAAPVDMALLSREHKIYQRARQPRLPILIVCGSPRSGTTVVAKAIARSFDASYFTNITAVFPRSPIASSQLFRSLPRTDRLTLRSHYGRTSGFLGWNDGLHIWDRWLGTDRTSIRRHIDRHDGHGMSRFMGAYEDWTGKPLITKNNNLVAHAAQIAEYLPTATFLCVDRDPLFLAQSLLCARRYIHGEDSAVYGLVDPESDRQCDPLTDVCQQVRYYRSLAHEQLAALGTDRFRSVDYGKFCRRPGDVIRELASEVLDMPVIEDRVPQSLRESRKRKISDHEFQRLESVIASGTIE